MTAPRDVRYDDRMGDALKDPSEAGASIEVVMELHDPASWFACKAAA